MGGKLESKYIGPYEVVSLQGKGRAKLQKSFNRQGTEKYISHGEFEAVQT